MTESTRISSEKKHELLKERHKLLETVQYLKSQLNKSVHGDYYWKTVTPTYLSIVYVNLLSKTLSIVLSSAVCQNSLWSFTQKKGDQAVSECGHYSIEFFKKEVIDRYRKEAPEVECVFNFITDINTRYFPRSDSGFCNMLCTFIVNYIKGYWGLRPLVSVSMGADVEWM